MVVSGAAQGRVKNLELCFAARKALTCNYLGRSQVSSCFLSDLFCIAHIVIFRQMKNLGSFSKRGIYSLVLKKQQGCNL